MEQKKHRFRPTLTAYRQLESAVEDLKCLLSSSEKEKRWLCDDILEQKSKNHLCELSIGLMEAELKRLRDANTELSKINTKLTQEAQRIASRGFWARLFNL